MPADEADDPAFGRIMKPAQSKGASNFAMSLESSCSVCEESHHPTKCPTLMSSTIDDRWQIVKEKNLCFSCLDVGHPVSECTFRKTCGVQGCDRWHATLLHEASKPRRPGPTGRRRAPQGDWRSPQEQKGGGQAAGPSKKRRDCRADPGEMRTQPQSVSPSQPEPAQHSNSCISVGKVALPVVPDSADLLIGMDCPDALTPLETVTGGAGEPYGGRTRLGWSKSGPVSNNEGGHEQSSHCYVSHGCPELLGRLGSVVNPDPVEATPTPNQRLEKHLDSFCELESSGLCDTTRGRSQQDGAVLRTRNQKIAVDDGHYTLPMTFREETSHLPNAHGIAEKRLSCLARKLPKDLSLKEQYAAGMADLITKGYAVEAPTDELGCKDGRVWYLPRHPVTRTVFDRGKGRGQRTVGMRTAASRE